MVTANFGHPLQILTKNNKCCCYGNCEQIPIPKRLLTIYKTLMSTAENKCYYFLGEKFEQGIRDFLNVIHLSMLVYCTCTFTIYSWGLTRLMYTTYIWVINQVQGQDSWILVKLLSGVDWDRVEVPKLAKKKRTRAISSHLDRTNLVNKGFTVLYGLQGKLSCRTPRVVPSG